MLSVMLCTLTHRQNIMPVLTWMMVGFKVKLSVGVSLLTVDHCNEFASLTRISKKWSKPSIWGC